MVGTHFCSFGTPASAGAGLERFLPFWNLERISSLLERLIAFMPEEDKPTAWFDPLYKNADDEGNGVPWANMATHPGFDAWLARANPHL